MHIPRKGRRLTRTPYRRARGPAAPSPEIGLYVDEAVTRAMVERVTEEVRDLRERLMNFLFIVLGGIVIDILTRTWRR
jgi:hypothetical protein